MPGAKQAQRVSANQVSIRDYNPKLNWEIDVLVY